MEFDSGVHHCFHFGRGGVFLHVGVVVLGHGQWQPQRRCLEQFVWVATHFIETIGMFDLFKNFIVGFFNGLFRKNQWIFFYIETW